MKAEDRIKRARHVNEMQKLLETPLDPKLDYYDATASIEAMAKHIQGLHKLIQFLSQSLVQQGASVIEIRERQAIQQGAIETLANMVGAEQEGASGLVGFEKKPLIKLDS